MPHDSDSAPPDVAADRADDTDTTVVARPSAGTRPTAAAAARWLSAAVAEMGTQRGRGGWLVPSSLVAALAAGLVVGPMLVPAAAERATAAASMQSIGDGAVADPPPPPHERGAQQAERKAKQKAERKAKQQAKRKAARAAIPLTTRFPTITGQTVDPGPKVTGRIPATLPVPADSGSGRRIIYGATAQHVWIVDRDGTVERDYPVTGRIDRPGPGHYRIYSKSPASSNPIAKVTFTQMVRFAHGVTGAAIGFHSIPLWANGKPLQTPESLGLALGRGGCIRQTPANARFLYRWAKVGDRVVVIR